MRRAHRVDANHGAIIDALRRVGALVADTSALGGGFPDLVVAFRGRLVLLEVKDGAKSPSERKFTVPEQAFHLLWRDHVRVVESTAQAMAAIGLRIATSASGTGQVERGRGVT